MIQVVIPKWVNPRGRKALLSFLAGLDQLGVPCVGVSLDAARPSVYPMVCWGVYKEILPGRSAIKYLQEQQKVVGDLVIIERGFVHREDYYMVAWNNINGRGTYPHSDWMEIPPGRWRKLDVHLEPWKRDGHETLVIGQVPWDTTCQHINMIEWVQETIRILKRNNHNPVVFRPHPLQPSAIPTIGLGVVIDRRPLSEALKQAKWVVTFCSNVGVDATIAGVRATADDPTSMIHKMRQTRRDRWARWLSYCQWSLKEIAQGMPWQHFYPEGR